MSRFCRALAITGLHSLEKSGQEIQVSLSYTFQGIPKPTCLKVSYDHIGWTDKYCQSCCSDFCQKDVQTTLKKAISINQANQWRDASWFTHWKERIMFQISPRFLTFLLEQDLDRHTSTAQPGRYMLRQLGLILQLDSDRLTLRFRMKLCVEWSNQSRYDRWCTNHGTGMNKGILIRETNTETIAFGFAVGTFDLRFSDRSVHLGRFPRHVIDNTGQTGALQ